MHSVTFHGKDVFATSLEKRKIVKINLEKCEITASVGGLGWGAGQFLWPTTVTNWDDRHIVVSDAHTGRISIIEAETMTVVDTFGTNGPGASAFNTSLR